MDHGLQQRHIRFGAGTATWCAALLAFLPFNSTAPIIALRLSAAAAQEGARDAHQISLGQTSTEVIAILGQPDQIVDLGARVIYVYKDRRIVFTNGAVTDVGEGKSSGSASANSVIHSSAELRDNSSPDTQPSGDANRLGVETNCLRAGDEGVRDEIHGAIRILGGTGSFAGISSSKKLLTVHPRSPLVGSVRLHVVNGGKPDAVAPLIGTVSWGDPSHAFWTIESSVRTRQQDLETQVQVTVPTAPGMYHIVFAMQLELSGSNVASGTDWALHHDTWDDGNEIARFDLKQILQAQQAGCTTDRWLTTRGYELMAVPADAITLQVL